MRSWTPTDYLSNKSRLPAAAHMSKYGYYAEWKKAVHTSK